MKYILIFLALLCSTTSYCQIINTIYGTGVAANTGDGGPADTADINLPGFLAYDKEGNLFLTTSTPGRTIRRISTSGIITTYAGTTGMGGYSGDGGPATSAKLKMPAALAFDTSGNLFVADYENHVIRKIDKATNIITTFAGTGVSGYSGDGGPAILAKLNYPSGICFDKRNNLYISDKANRRIRMVNPSGIISHVAGTGVSANTGDGGLADTAGIIGTATDVMCVDDSDNLYVPAAGKIRKINLNTRIISTFAGTGVIGVSGDGGPATTANISAWIIYKDRLGNFYFNDGGQEYIRKIDPSGVITTVVGNGTEGFSGDGGLATSAALWNPAGMVTDSCGNLIFSDCGNRRIRKVTFYPSCLQPNAITETYATTFSLSPNPVSSVLHIAGTTGLGAYELHDLTGRVVGAGRLSQPSTDINMESIPLGLYLLRITGQGGSGTYKVVKE